MGCCKNFIPGHGFRCFPTSFLVFCLIFLVSSQSQYSRLLINAEGRKLPRTADDDGHSKITAFKEEKAIIFRAQIGSRPPRCQRRCNSCTRCDAIQVPTNPQTRNGIKTAATAVNVAYYGRGEERSNYKPMSWKCKCGNLIFNP